MRNDVDDIKKLIKSRFKASNIEIPEKELEALTRKYGSTDYNLLIIKDQVDLITMMINVNKKKSLFNSEEIGDILAYMQLKQHDINDAEKHLRNKVNAYAKENGIYIEPEERAYHSENRIKFSPEEFQVVLALMKLNQHDINEAETVLYHMADEQRKKDVLEDMKNA